MIRQSKISDGTVGSLPCEVSLNAILLNENNAKVTRKVMSRYNNYRRGLERLIKMAEIDPYFTEDLIHLWKADQFGKINNDLPKDAYTHLRCCMTAQHRETLVKIKELKKSSGLTHNRSKSTICLTRYG